MNSEPIPASWEKIRRHWPWPWRWPQIENAESRGQRAYPYQDYQYQRINLDISNFRRSPAQLMGGWKDFCPECGGLMRVDPNEIDLVCEACGLLDETQFVFACDYEELLERAKEVTLSKFAIYEDHRHKPSVKQRLRSSKMDQRVESILLSQDNIEKITDSFGDWYKVKISKLLNFYNEDLGNNDLVNYNPISLIR